MPDAIPVYGKSPVTAAIKTVGAAAPQPAKAVVWSPDSVTLSAIDVPVEQWQKMSVVDKYNAVMPAVPPHSSTQVVVQAIDSLDRKHPTPPVVQYHERTRYVPAPPEAKSIVRAAGQPSGPSINMTSMVVWLGLGLVAGGILYYTTHMNVAAR